MSSRTEQRFGLRPERLAADTACDAAAALNSLVERIASHVPVIDKSKREDRSLSRKDVTFEKDGNVQGLSGPTSAQFGDNTSKSWQAASSSQVYAKRFFRDDRQERGFRMREGDGATKDLGAAFDSYVERVEFPYLKHVQ